MSLTLSPTITLLLRLVKEAKGIKSDDEAISRAICIYADHVGIPSLAKPIDEQICEEAEFRGGGP